MKLLVAAILVTAGCSNKAVDYAFMVFPELKCEATKTNTGCGRGNFDVALCRAGREVWECRYDLDRDKGECQPLRRDLPVEAL